MAQRDLVVVGGSAGAIRALSALLAALPGDLAASVVVVLHRPEYGSDGLRAVLSRASSLPVTTAVQGEPLAPAWVYLAPSGAHLLVRPDQLVLSRGARINRVRPAVDPLFSSAARWFGPRAIGVILSGSLDDGAAGLAAIHQRGGVCLTQDPEEALFPGMPSAALAAVPAAKALPMEELAAAVLELTGQPVPAVEPDVDSGLLESAVMGEMEDAVGRLERLGEPVSISCPECRGGMTRIDAPGPAQYRCHVGHTYSPQNMLVAQSEAAESALWTAVSILEEQEAVHRQLAEQATGLERARHLEAQARAAAAAVSVRRTITGTRSPASSGQPAED